MPARSTSIRKHKLFAQAILTLSALATFGSAIVPVDAAQPIQGAFDISNTLNQTQQTPVPPPPGTFGNPPAVTAGDTGGLPPAPTGQADQTAGTNFPVGTGQTDSTVRIFVDSNGRGLRQVQTIRPTTLSQQALGQVQGALGVNLLSGEPVIDVTVSKAQMEQLNQILAPYPNYDMNGNRKKINNDSPAQGYPKETPNYDFKGPLPTVRTFSRYLVILGVVCSTVFMALASAKVILGHRDAGGCVVGSVAGLMLLLMGYTIWKIVQMNTFKDNTNGPAQIMQKSGQGAASDAFLTQPTVPAVPTVNGGGVQRSGIPVIPLSGN